MGQLRRPRGKSHGTHQSLCRCRDYRGDAEFTSRASLGRSVLVSSVPMTRDLVLAPADNIRLVELCGPLDQHLHQIEARLGVEVKRRGNRFQIVGMPAAIKRAEAVLQDLYTRAQREPVDSERVHIALQELEMEGAANRRAVDGGAGIRAPATRG